MIFAAILAVVLAQPIYWPVEGTWCAKSQWIGEVSETCVYPAAGGEQLGCITNPVVTLECEAVSGEPCYCIPVTLPIGGKSIPIVARNRFGEVWSGDSNEARIGMPFAPVLME
jgi:hypothetical protein